ncbi:hypothetical protein GH714_022340 [Hevea brasiliensis]|uniref:Uncharacterized protein n=1 Tax=Hevea brasiliensis TaxID=3981 RepID=A0A6A6MA74_HEVBR|nr:hypothetical protein GH714_022340 [Hevea brasiliensis]
MGSFKGHALPGTLFLLVGVWHVWSSLFRYVSNPKAFRVRVWNPVPGFDGKLKYFELYLVVVGAFIDLCIELLYSTHLKFFVNGVLNPNHMNDFEHSGCFSCSLYLELFLWFQRKPGSRNGSAKAWLPMFLINDCFTAFTLYGPMIPDGCQLKNDQITCPSVGSQVRGELLANFQLFALVFVVLVAVAVSYSFLASKYGILMSEACMRLRMDWIQISIGWNYMCRDYHGWKNSKSSFYGAPQISMTQDHLHLSTQTL